MKAKQLIILAGLLAVAVIVAIAVSGGDKNETPEGAVAVGDKLFGDLPVNDVTSVTITGDEKSVELERTGETWTVKNRGAYPADFKKLVRTLRTLKDLTVAETVKAGASAYGRLEIKDPAGEKDEKAGTKVELKSADGSELAAMVLGMNYTGGRSGNETPRYLRVPSDTSQVFVVPKTFYDLQPDPSSWLVRDFFRVVKPKNVTVTQSEGETFKFTRDKEGGELMLEGLGDDEELNTANTGTIGSPFASASFKDVAVGDEAKAERTGLDKPVKIEVETFEGFKYVVNLGKGEGDNVDSTAAQATVTPANYYLTVEVSADLPTERVPEDDEKVAADASDEVKKKAEDLKKQRDDKFKADQDAAKEKLEKEKAYAGIVYKVDSWVADKFFKPRTELVKAKEKEEGEGAAGATSATTPPVSLQPLGGDKPKVVATTPPISVADILAKSQEHSSEASDAAAEDPEAPVTDEAGEADKADAPAGEEGSSEEGAAEDAGAEEPVSDDAGAAEDAGAEDAPE